MESGQAGTALRKLRGMESLHDDWQQLLRSSVYPRPDGAGTCVDYEYLARDCVRLQRYLDALGAVSATTVAQLGAPARHAFRINAYNAHVVARVLAATRRPRSIRHLGLPGIGPWWERRLLLEGRRMSLAHLEHRLIRRDEVFDPRIHMALNCASIGCPALRAEAYDADHLDKQLDQQVQQFLRDRSHNRVDTLQGRIVVSPIFRWFARDFRGSSQDVRHWLRRYPEALAPSAEERKVLNDPKARLAYSRYDWGLNACAPDHLGDNDRGQ